MPSKLSLGLLAKHNVAWTAGKLYLNTIAQTLEHLASTSRPSIHLLMTKQEQASHRSSLSFECDSEIIHTGLHKRFKSRIRKTLQGLTGQSQASGSLEREVVRNKIDCVLPCQTSLGTKFPVPWIGWIPDFQHKHYPQYFSARELAKRDLGFQRLCDDATLVTVSSQDARDDLLKWYSVRPENVKVYSFCTIPTPEWFEPDARAIADRHGLPEKYLLYSSQFWIHKNHLALFRAIERILEKHPNIALVLTGSDQDYRHPKYANKLKALLNSDRLRNRVFWLGLLPRLEQIQIMRCAAAVVQPSLFEGWSMLVEDSRSLGKPICLSDIPIHREQAPPQGTFFDPNDVQQMADAIQQVWQQSSPGPNATAEAQAKQELQRRATDNAYTLADIVSQAVEVGNSAAAS